MKKLFALIFCMILLVGTVSALDFTLDNYKVFEETNGYGRINVWDKGQIGEDKKLIKYELIENTDQCLINCYAEGTATLYTNGKIFSDLSFKDRKGKFTNLEKSNIFIWTTEEYEIEVNDYKEVCETINANGTEKEVCLSELSGTHVKTKTRELWKEYNFENLKAGNYKWRIEGTKKIYENIDWIGKGFGEDLTEWAWWNTDWGKKQKINITQEASASTTDYQVYIPVTYDSDMNSNFSDLRFINGSENMELDYWIESKEDGVGAEIWVEVPSLASLDVTEIYMYYENAGASTTSDGGATFLLFDDFPGSSVNTSIWEEAIGTASVGSGQLSYTGTTYLKLANALTDTGMRLKRERNWANGGTHNAWGFWATGGVSTPATVCDRSVFWNDATGAMTYNSNNPAGCGFDQSTGLTQAQFTGWHNETIDIFDNSTHNNQTLYLDGVVKGVHTEDLGTDSFELIQGGTSMPGTTYVNFVFVAKLILPEPTIAFGEEELNFGITTIQSYPKDNVNTTNNVVGIGCNFTGTGGENITDVTVLVYNSSDNLDYINTESGLSSKSYNKTWTTTALTDDTYLWACLGEGTSTDSYAGNRTFTIDTTNPTLTVISPIGNQGTFVSGRNLSLNWNVSDTHLQACFYDYGGSNTTVTCGDNQTNLTIFSSENITLAFYANDSFGHLTRKNISWSYTFAESSVSYTTNVSETSAQNFELNLTTSVNVLSITSNLNYNGSKYSSLSSCTGFNCTISNIIDIPLVSKQSQIHDFFWEISIFDGTSSVNVNTSTRTQNASMIYFEQCNATWTTKTLNFTTFDEQNLTRIKPFEFDGSFNFWLGGGSVYKNSSFSINNSEVNLCLFPNDTMKIDVNINYDESGNLSLYTDRFYYFDNHSINNITQHFNMYLLQSAFSTSFILKVQDENLLPVSNALIEIHRYYPGENIFRIVQIAKTDDNGKSIGFFQTETVDYKFIIKKDGETLLTTGVQKVVPEISPFTLTFNTGGELDSPWVGHEDISSLTSTLTWNKDTGLVSFIYIDTSANFTSGRLFVTKSSLTNSSAITTICNNISTLSSATITCGVGNTSGFYISSSYITRAGESLIEQISFQIETFSSVAGLLGLFLGWFIILIAAFMFTFNEIAGIWAITITIFLVNIMGLIKFGTVFVSVTFGVALILTWLMRR